jgi:O-antigen ligase
LNILPQIIALVGLILAVTIGIFIAEGRNALLAIGFGLPFLYLFIKTAGAYCILIGLVFSSVGVSIQPIGPRLDPLHIVLLMAVMFLVGNFWRRVPSTESNDAKKYFRPFMVCFSILLTYTVAVSYFHTAFPHAYMGYALNNLLKQQTAICGGFLLIALTYLFGRKFRLNKNPVLFILIALEIGLVFNLALRLYGIYFLRIGEIDVMTGQETPYSAVFIPVVNATDNAFILRVLGPIAACISTAVLTTKCQANRKPFVQFSALCVLVLGLLGALVSQGRISIFLAAVMVGAILMIRRKIGFLLILLGMFILFISAAKIVYEYDSRLVPAAVQRTLGWLPFMQTTQARASIDSSTEWRTRLFNTSLEEIESSSRILILGRGVYAFDQRESAIIQQDGFNGAIEVNRRRAASHNLITDVILTNGGVGLFLYVSTYLALIWGLFKAAKQGNVTAASNDLAVSSLVSIFFSLLYAFVGGGFLQAIDALIISVIILLLGKNTQATGKVIKPAFAPKLP